MEVDESQLTGESDMVPKRVGDEVFSGSYPTSGRGRYVARTVGEASLAGRITAGAKTFRRTLTPLQRQIQTVIRVTLGVVLYLQLLLVVKNVVDDTPLDQAIIEATVLVGLVPNGLFVSIAIAYALAAVRMSRFGALVQQANAVESLSHVDTLCVDKTGTLTANQLELDQVVPLEGDEASARARVGLMVASGRATNKTSEAVAEGVQAAARTPLAEVPFSSKRKWSAVALPAGVSPSHAPDGTYAFGAPTFLRNTSTSATRSGATSRPWSRTTPRAACGCCLRPTAPRPCWRMSATTRSCHATASRTPSWCCGTCYDPRRPRR